MNRLTWEKIEENSSCIHFHSNMQSSGRELLFRICPKRPLQHCFITKYKRSLNHAALSVYWQNESLAPTSKTFLFGTPKIVPVLSPHRPVLHLAQPTMNIPTVLEHHYIAFIYEVGRIHVYFCTTDRFTKFSYAYRKSCRVCCWQLFVPLLKLPGYWRV